MVRSMLGLLLLAATTPLEAQRPLPSVPQRLGLEEAVALAQRHNPNWLRAANDLTPASWAARNALTEMLLPSVSASAGINYTGAGSQTFLSQEFSQPSSTIGSNYSLRLNWTLSGRTLSQPATARAQQHAAEATLDGTANNIRTGITQQYLAVLQAREQVGLAEVQVRRNQEFLRLADARFQVGQATQLDVRQAQVALGQSEVQLLQNQQLVVVSILRLFEQMGIPAPDDPNVVSLSDTFPVTEPTWALTDLLREADASNPDVLAFDAQASAARWSARAARSQWLPTVSLSAGWSGFTQQFTNTSPLVANAISDAQLASQRNQAECQFTNSAWLNAGETPLDCSALAFTQAQEDAIRSQVAARNSVWPFDFTRQPFQASLSISLPLFTQFNRVAQISQAQAQAEDAQYAADGRRLQLRTLVSEAYYSLRTAYATIGIQVTNREAAGEQLRLATERYRVGSGTFFELLDAQLAAQRAEADYINAVYAYHRSVAALEAAVGRPLR